MTTPTPRWLLGLALVLAAAGGAAAIDITDCGQTVPARGRGVLTTDLVCSDSASAAFIGDRGELAFAGHSISGGGVFCAGSCALKGPGTIQNVMPANSFGGASGVFTAIWDAKLVVRDLVVLSSKNGIVSNAKRIILNNVIASNNLENGITVFGRLSGVVVTTNGNGGVGLAAYNDTSQVRLNRFTATGNGFGGLNSQGRRTLLLRSTLTGNSYPPFPGMPTAIDLVSTARPRLIATTCDQSWGPNDAPWGVCTND